MSNCDPLGRPASRTGGLPGKGIISDQSLFSPLWTAHHLHHLVGPRVILGETCFFATCRELPETRFPNESPPTKRVARNPSPPPPTTTTTSTAQRQQQPQKQQQEQRQKRTAGRLQRAMKNVFCNEAVGDEAPKEFDHVGSGLIVSCFSGTGTIISLRWPYTYQVSSSSSKAPKVNTHHHHRAGLKMITS
jgi:hypothetical protein